MVKIFYNEKQVNFNKNFLSGITKSPLKPYLLMKAINESHFRDNVEIESDFIPFTDDDFRIAHTDEYVNGFFRGTPGICETNGIKWSPQLADSVRWTNSSLYSALRHSILNPNQISLSMTSGFHHAQPNNGLGFCTFSGQVIAGIKLWREFGVSGAVLDLDGHYGNSIEDTRNFAPQLNSAIPIGFNFAQLNGNNNTYVSYLKAALRQIEQAIIENKIHYVLWCHGADSHKDDDYGGQVNTQYWVQCSNVFYDWVLQMNKKLALIGRSALPIAMSLFGGYRKDSYSSVLSLHLKDLATCINTFYNPEFAYDVKVESPLITRCKEEKWIDGMPLSVIKMLEEFKNK